MIDEGIQSHRCEPLLKNDHNVVGMTSEHEILSDESLHIGTSVHFFLGWKAPFILFGLPSVVFGSVILAYFPTSANEDGDVIPYPRLNLGISLLMAACVFFSTAGIAPFHKMSINKRFDLLLSSGHVPQSALAAIFLGSNNALKPETWLNLICGNASPYLWWQPRGLLWMSLLVAFFVSTTSFFFAKYMARLSDFLSLNAACFGFFAGLEVGYCARAIFIPYTFLCAQVGFSVGSGTRIGLWDRSDPSLRALQSLSFQYSLTITIAITLVIVGCFLSGVPLWMSIVASTGSVGLIIVILLSPILPLSATLSDKKADHLAKMSTLIENQHILVMENFKAGLNNKEATETLKGMYEERQKINDVEVLPESTKLLYTGALSIAIAVAPMLYGSISSQI